MKHILLIILVFLVTIDVSIGQKALSNGEQIKILLKDGTTVVGSLSNMSTDVVTLETEFLGNLSIQRDHISEMFSIEPKNKEQSTKLVENTEHLDKNGIPFDYYNSSQYILNQSAFSLKKGQKYYQNIGIFLNSFGFGISDNFDLAVGGEVATLLFDSRFPLLYITPKYTFDIIQDRSAFSLGTTFVTVPSNNFSSAGFFQGAFTFGDRNNNITVGTGIGYTFEDGFSDSFVPLLFSFMTRVGPKFSIVSENFYVNSDSFSSGFGLISLFGRIHFPKNPGAAFNVGLIRPTEGIGSVIAIPMLSALIPLGVK